jgi:transposase
MAKRLIQNAKLTNRDISKLIDFFVLEVPALRAAKTLTINRHSAERIYTKIRVAIAKECERQSPFSGEVEVDESYFGGRKKGEIGRQVASKVPVFGLIKRSGKVYTRIVEDVTRWTLEKIIREKVTTDSTIYSDSFVSYDGLVVYGYKHYRINHQKNYATGKNNHINGIENFWGYAKTRLRKYHGISRKHFYFYLKEMEFRFNNRKEPNLAVIIKRILTKH